MSEGNTLDDISTRLLELKGDMREGFASLNGKLDLITQANGQTVKDLSDLEERHEALDARVAALEERRWPLGAMAVLATVVGAVAAVGAWLASR